MLTSEELKWITQEIAPPTPNEHSTQEEKNNYHCQQRADQKTKCIILRSLDNVLQHQHVSIPTTYDILISLYEMFGGKGRLAVLKAIIDTKMLKGTLIRDHKIHVIELFNEMEILRVEIKGETQVDMVPETLSDSLQ